VVAALGSVESMMPLHCVIASARLRSSIAVDSTCWSFLSQDCIGESELAIYHRFVQSEYNLTSSSAYYYSDFRLSGWCGCDDNVALNAAEFEFVKPYGAVYLKLST
ncbi:hypothetical protein Tco_0046588, partial [Tanacetum coccineum]